MRGSGDSQDMMTELIKFSRAMRPQNRLREYSDRFYQIQYVSCRINILLSITPALIVSASPTGMTAALERVNVLRSLSHESQAPSPNPAVHETGQGRRLLFHATDGKLDIQVLHRHYTER